MRVLIPIFILLISFNVSAQKTESPYIKVLTKEAIIPLKSTKAVVQIVGKIAYIKITQTYHNKSNKAIEAEYVFPLSTKGAVHGMKMKIGNRSTTAKIYEKNTAEKIYNNAIREGKRASKLAQHRPNIFQINLGNIQPNDEVSIELLYTEMLTPVEGEYQFIFPGVVGPRFSGEEKVNNPKTIIPFTPTGFSETFNYDINVNIRTGTIIQYVNSSSHDIKVHYPDALSAELSLSKNNVSPANRDFILNYTMRGAEIEPGLLLYEGKDENFFSLMIEPPKKVITEKIPPREYIFIVDVSGSMMGYPIDVAKSLLRNLLGDLKQTDVFNILLFSAENKVFQKNSVNANDENLKKALQFLNGTFSNYGKGTHLLEALKKSYQLPRKINSSARTMVVITDGYVTVEKEVFQLIENNLDNASVVSFGIGNGVNRFLIEGLAKVGQSNSFIATSKEEAFKVSKVFKKYISSPLLTQIKLNKDNFEIYEVTPKSIPDVFSDRPIMIYGKYKGKASGSIQLSGYQGKTKVTKTIKIKNSNLSSSNKALKYLWARKRIEQLDDYRTHFGDDVKDQVVALGLAYNLASKYTSFVAVDNEIISNKGALNTTKQPLPMTLGVKYSSIGIEAKIKGTTVLQREFTITIKSEIKNPKKLKKWLLNSYSKIIKEYLKKYPKIKIYINKKGDVTHVKREENGSWLEDFKLINIMNKVPKKLHIKNEVIITIKKIMYPKKEKI